MAVASEGRGERRKGRGNSRRETGLKVGGRLKDEGGHEGLKGREGVGMTKEAEHGRGRGGGR